MVELPLQHLGKLPCRRLIEARQKRPSRSATSSLKLLRAPGRSGDRDGAEDIGHADLDIVFQCPASCRQDCLFVADLKMKLSRGRCRAVQFHQPARQLFALLPDDALTAGG